MAEDSHVLQMSVAPQVLERTGGLAEPETVGINRGSTFTGFCDYHDSVLFRDIEAEPFVGRPDQCRILSYRAVAREVFQKKAAVDAAEVMRTADRGRSTPEQLVIQKFVSNYMIGTEAGLRSIQAHKDEIEAAIDAGSEKGRGLLLWLDQVPSVMCSGGVFPDEDCFGESIQDLADVSRRPDLVTFSMFASEGRGVAAFTWEESSSASAERLVRPLLTLPEGKLTAVLAHYAFEYFENTLFRPSWWKGLPDSTKETLQRAAVSGSPFTLHKGERMKDALWGPVPWQVSNIEWVGEQAQ